MRPPDRRNPVPAAAGNGVSRDHAGQQIDPRHSQPRRKKQTIAIARNFGCVFAVFVREAGTERRVGLYGDTGAAAAAAESLNLRFQTEGAAT